MRRPLMAVLSALGIFVVITFVNHPASAQDRPNILVVWGDDIGSVVV